MSQWLVTQGDNQFKVSGMAELKEMAGAGRLHAGDLIQPPEASDWLYATEIPALQGLFSDDDFDDIPSRGAGAMRALQMALGAGFMFTTLLGIGGMVYFYQQLPSGDDVFIGDGGYSYSQMIVTDAGSPLLSTPESTGKPVVALQKDQTLSLLSKRGDFYRARTTDGLEGWIQEAAVIPLYQLGGSEVRSEMDPLYNPDRYVDVANASWMQLPEQEEQDEKVTVFQFMLRNEAQYTMTDVVLMATIKDAKGTELERVEIPIEGEIPANGNTMVGTFSPEKENTEEEPRLMTNYTFDKMAADDPDLQLRFSAGVEITMTSEDFDNASVELLELRAIPDDQQVAQQ